MKQLKAAIWGASGYTGGELVRILSRHPSVALSQVFAERSAGMLVSDVHAWAPESAPTTRFETFEESTELDADVCFLALPHGEAMELAPALLDRGKIVIDLSGDHRLQDRTLFEKYYKRPQTSGEILADAVYGLPEWNQEAIAKARFIANPGCYATSAILALAPLVVEGMIDTQSIIINSMSGVSGAGRKAAIEYSFVEVNENVKAYRIGDHQHIPEIETVLQNLRIQYGAREARGPRHYNSDVKMTFTPHLIPITRGIYTTICAELSGPLGETELHETFQKHYAEKPFVRYSASRAPEIRRVTGTNFIDIYAQLLPERNQVIIISTLDNLVKGAAGQAVQNMNILCGFPETEGLL
ncbi:MAG: N-acetyl-gamma-glutamyl-phosphate reductase [Candidatus Kapaibacterium sp.]